MPILQPKQIFEGLEVQYLIKKNRYCETYRVEDEDQKSFFLKLFIKERMPERTVKYDGTIPSITLSMDLRADAILPVEVSSFVEIEGYGACSYILTEYFAGELLEDRLNREGALPLGEAVRIYKAILRGLVYLHVHYPPLVHNDITPRNILLTNDGAVKIIDLGHLSYVKNSSERPPFDIDDLDVRYHAREVILNIFNEKTDLFSATAVFYHMLFGEAPWNLTGPNCPSFLTRMRAMLIQRSEGGKLNMNRVAMPEELRVILRKGLESSIMERYDNVQQILSDLDNLLSFDAMLLEDVDIYQQAVVCGRVSFSGVVNFITKRNYVTALTFPSNVRVLDYQGVSYPVAYYGNPPEGEGDDLRQVLYWDPSLRVDAGGQSRVTFRTPGYAGRFRAVADGIAEDGSPVHYEWTFEVE